MKIIKRIPVKQIITEKSKEKIKKDLLHQKMLLEQECQQLLFEKKKLEYKAKGSKQDITDRFQQEIKNRKEKIKLADFKIEQLAMMEIGSEIIEKEVEALVEVKEGSHWDDIMDEKAIVIEDGVIIRIDK